MKNNSQEKHLSVVRTARYYQLGELHPGVRKIWFVLHGYGQLATYFIQHFKSIADETTVVVAPEALSRFYTDGVSGRVGATWMTKEDRLCEIQDYVRYLDQLYEEIIAPLPDTPELVLLGFSQGTATAWRWMKNGKIRPQHLVNWAGSIPHENSADWANRLAPLNLYMVLGNQDEYISPEAAEKYLAALQKLKPGLEFIAFEGKHRMDADTLRILQGKILEKSS